MKRSPYLREPQLKNYNFNQCIDITSPEQLELARKYQEIVFELNTIGTYRSTRLNDDKKQAVLDTIMPIIDKNPNLKYMYYINYERNYSSTLGKEFLRVGFDSIVEDFLSDHHASTIVDHMGINLGMSCAYEGNDRLTSIALDNETARRQQSNSGLNIGMISAKNKLLNSTLKALDDDVASAQQSSDGETIGMICARVIAGDRSMIPAFEKSASNPHTILIADNQGRTIIDIAKQSCFTGSTFAQKFEKTLLHAQLMQENMEK